MKPRTAGAAAVIVAVLLAAPLLTAENSQSVKFSLYSNLARLGDDSLSLTGLGEALYGIQSEGDRNVKAEFQLSATVFNASGGLPSAMLEIPKAYVRVRFPGFRLTAGKTRLSWGEGFFFNAGDILFGSTSTGSDLMSEVLRDDTAWLLSSWHSLGTFSYLETVVMPPALTASSFSGALPEASELTGGVRLETKIAELRSQAGYLYRGADDVHSAYLSLQGNLFVDWYTATSTRISADNPDADAVKEASQLSFGLFHIRNFTEGGSLTARLEGLVRPWGEWEEPSSVFARPAYGLLLYPEVSWAPSQFLSFQLRSIVSPVDGSALVSLGGFWKPYQGFTFLAFLTTQAGDTDDLYGFDRDGGYALTAGIRYVF